MKRFKKCANSIAFKYFNEQCPNCLSEVLDVATESNIQFIGTFQKSKCPFCKTKTVSVLCLTLDQLFRKKSWTHPSVLTILIPSNTFKHSLKKHFLNEHKSYTF